MTLRADEISSIIQSEIENFGQPVRAVNVGTVVEVGADQKDHLVGWLSKRVGVTLTAPDLESQGFRLIGGRLLPAGTTGMAAQFMYEDATGRRVSEVGAELGVSSGTVRSHVKSLRAKLGAPTQLKAVAMFHQAHERVYAVDLVPAPRHDGEEGSLEAVQESTQELGQQGGGPGAEHAAGMTGEVSGGGVTLARR